MFDWSRYHMELVTLCSDGDLPFFVAVREARHLAGWVSYCAANTYSTDGLPERVSALATYTRVAGLRPRSLTGEV